MRNKNKQTRIAQGHLSLKDCMLLVGIVLAGLSLRGGSVPAAELHDSELDLAFHQVRYSAQERITAYTTGGESFDADNAAINDDVTDDVAAELAGDFGESGLAGRKNVFKATVLSLLVPGLGQVYNGSHIGKVALFAGTDVALLLGARKFDTEANNKVAGFEDFARANWTEADYWDYLAKVYGDTTDIDDDLGASHGHHLPSTQTQQYFEMIGKYDQFSYGWARAEGDTLPWDTAADSSRYEYNDGNRYRSPKRLSYNEMRASANKSFGKRDRMLIFTIVNHVVSAVDAALSANRHNKTLENSASSVSFHPSVRHDENWALIPELQMRWRF